MFAKKFGYQIICFGLSSILVVKNTWGSSRTDVILVNNVMLL